MGYHVKTELFQTKLDAIALAPTEQVEKWASDPNCIEQQKCIDEMKARAERTKREAAQLEAEALANAAAIEKKRLDLSERRKGLEEFPFDPRTEVSADAKHIATRTVQNLWGIWWATLALGVLVGIIAASSPH